MFCFGSYVGRHQAQQAEHQSQYVCGSKPTEALWPIKRAAGTDKTLGPFEPYLALNSHDLQSNTKQCKGCRERHLSQIF